MGLIEGTPVRMVKRAPWGDPVQLFVRGYHLAISRKTAQTILVK
jgi:Fe2+ transport system protein FeoA